MFGVTKHLRFAVFGSERDVERLNSTGLSRRPTLQFRKWFGQRLEAIQSGLGEKLDDVSSELPSVRSNINDGLNRQMPQSQQRAAGAAVGSGEFQSNHFKRAFDDRPNRSHSIAFLQAR
jgi:hypothetical protein